MPDIQVMLCDKDPYPDESAVYDVGKELLDLAMQNPNRWVVAIAPGSYHVLERIAAKFADYKGYSVRPDPESDRLYVRKLT